MPRQIALSASLALILALGVGCDGGGGEIGPPGGDAGRGGDGATPDTDGGAPGDGGGAGIAAPPAAPMPPAAIALPAMTPCPAGWREIASADPSSPATCDPWPATGIATCGIDQAHFPGGAGCVRIGAACPASGLPEGLPAATPTLWVSASATGGGADGTMARPFRTIGAALSAATSGTIVAIGAGTYDEDLIVPAGVTLWGACTATTVLTSSRVLDTTEAIVNIREGEVALRNLRIGAGAVRGGIHATGGATARVEAVIVGDIEDFGVLIDGSATVTGTDVVVRDVRSRASDRRYGMGVAAEHGSVTLARLAIERTQSSGFIANFPDTVVSLEDVVIREVESESGDASGGQLFQAVASTSTLRRAYLSTGRIANVVALGTGTRLLLEDAVVLDARPTLAPGMTGLYGELVHAESAAEVRLVRARLEGAYRTGIVARGATVIAEDALLADIRGEMSTGDLGHGVLVDFAGTFTATRMRIDRPRLSGVIAMGAGSTVSATDILVSEVRPGAADVQWGFGIVVAQQATGTIERGEVSNAVGVGIIASDMGTSLTADDVTVRSTQPHSEGRWGRGVHAQYGGAIAGNRWLLEGNHEGAVSLSFDGTSITLSDLVARDTLPRPGNEFGYGVQAIENARLTLTRAVFERCHEVGIISGLGATVMAQDLVVRDTQPTVRALGRGISAQSGSIVQVARAVISGSRETAIAALEPGTSVTMTDARLVDTRTTECGGCASGSAVVAESSRVTMTRFEIDNADLCGLLLGGTSEVDLDTGLVIGCNIGACVQVPGYDLDRLSRAVEYRDNVVNLDATTLPLPDPLDPVETSR